MGRGRSGVGLSVGLIYCLSVRAFPQSHGGSLCLFLSSFFPFACLCLLYLPAPLSIRLYSFPLPTFFLSTLLFPFFSPVPPLLPILSYLTFSHYVFVPSTSFLFPPLFHFLPSILHSNPSLLVSIPPYSFPCFPPCSLCMFACLFVSMLITF